MIHDAVTDSSKGSGVFVVATAPEDDTVRLDVASADLGVVLVDKTLEGPFVHMAREGRVLGVEVVLDAEGVVLESARVEEKAEGDDLAGRGLSVVVVGSLNYPAEPAVEVRGVHLRLDDVVDGVAVAGRDKDGEAVYESLPVGGESRGCGLRRGWSGILESRRPGHLDRL